MLRGQFSVQTTLGGHIVRMAEQANFTASRISIILGKFRAAAPDLCWTDECFDNIARDGLGSVVSFAGRELPRYIVNRAVLDTSAQKNWFEG